MDSWWQYDQKSGHENPGWKFTRTIIAWVDAHTQEGTDVSYHLSDVKAERRSRNQVVGSAKHIFTRFNNIMSLAFWERFGGEFVHRPGPKGERETHGGK
jgi:hypothetical protein